jgi:hypothetical protein
MPLLLAAVAALVLTSAVAAQEAPRPGDLPPHAAAPIAQALRIEEPIRVDGVLDESVWERATPVTQFTQIRPDEGRAASERTEIRILFDDAAIYIGARMYDSQPVSTRLGRRDQWMSSDWLTVIFDSYHDHRTAVGFEVNPSGVRRDQTRATGGGEDDSWDPVWEVATTIDDEGWTAEMRIPFSQLRFNPGAEQTWGLQLERNLERRGEFSVWSFTPSTHAGGIARFGHLEGLRDLRMGRRVEVLPYAVLRGERVDRHGNPFRDDVEGRAAVGLDLKYRVTSDLTLDATINPDFGQVEVDPAQVNLSAIETFFQERRPFFVEGAEIFRFGAGGGNQLFYSRRIGRSPQLPTGVQVADVPDAARILAAGKLSGRTTAGWSVGMLNAVTERVSARTWLEGDVEGSAVVEPLTNYFAGRARRDYRQGATVVGGMLTAVNRDLEGPIAVGRLHSAAYTGGMDFRHQWAERTWTLAGFVSGSYVEGDAAAIQRTQRLPWRYFQRPDADHLEVDPDATSLAGLSSEVNLSLRHGRHWRPSLLVGVITPGYEVSDLGFQRRGDRVDAQLQVGYVENRPGERLRQWNVYGTTRHEVNFGGEAVQRTVNASTWMQFLNYWSFNANANLGIPAWDDRLTRGGPLMRRPLSASGFAGMGTDFRRPLAAFVGANYAMNAEGGRGIFLFTEMEIKPAPNWSLSLGPEFNRTHTIAQYRTVVVDPAAENTFGRRYVFSTVDQTMLSLSTRLNFTFTPALTLQVFAQPFIASADFGAPGELAAPRTYEFLRYGVDLGEVEEVQGGRVIHPQGAGEGISFFVSEGDFNVRSLRGNAVLRWEWRPGSTLYLAWQQMRESFDPVGDFDLARDQRALFRTRPDDVLVLKINYWLNP